MKQEAVFKLDDKFVDQYAALKPPFGFNGLGEFVFLRSYSRLKESGENEQWYETVRRVVEGTYKMQERHIRSQDLGWSESRAQKSAQEMYDHIFNIRFLPPGRGLWAMGSAITEERGLYAALCNCAFVSTANIEKDLTEPFTFLMDASMLGVGVGFDVEGAGKINIISPYLPAKPFVIPDSREGWVESVRLFLEGYFGSGQPYEFDYSEIRREGELIRGFGGISSGPQPLIDLHKQLRRVLDRNVGSPITITTIVDIMNLIGVCVVSGNVRRSAEIALGPYDNEEYLGLKDYRWDAVECKYLGPQSDRAAYGWTSNNTVFAKIGMDYTDVTSRTQQNGEPGYLWLENSRQYSRMNGIVDNKDRRVSGINPCGEQPLESYEECCLVESFPYRCKNLAEYKRVLKFAYLYAKTVTLGKTHWPKTNKVMLRNRRIGTSQSGIAQAIARLGIHEYKKWCEEGYDAIQRYDKSYSEWLCVPQSIKTTSIKPSGSVSLCAGATPGCHDPEDHYYIRRTRAGASSNLVKVYREAGYTVEPAFEDPEKTVVIEFPCCVDELVPTVKETTLWEKVARAAFLQRYWADNQVSCTVVFSPEEANQIKPALEYFQYDLKGISFLPRLEGGAYAQMPYEAITKEQYEAITSRLKPLNFSNIAEEATPERGCDSSVCALGS